MAKGASLRWFERPGFWAGLLATALCLYLLSLGAYYVGFFNDDAFYLIGARSLLGGSYTELSHPAQPPLVNYLPGYPLLLAPLVGMFPGSTLPCQLLSVAMLVGSIWLFARLFAGELPPAATAAGAAVLAFNPLAVAMSGTILSDIPYLLLTLAFFIAARRTWPSRDPRRWAGLAALAAAGFLLRPTGAAFALALPLALLIERRWRLAILCVAVSAPLIALFPLRNFLVRGHGLTYAAELAAPFASAPAADALASAARNIPYYLNELFARSLLRWPAAGGAFLPALAGLAAAAYGALRFGTGGWRKLMLLYGAAYAAALILWPKQAGRYLLPVLPLILAWLFAGLADAERRLKKPLVLGAAALMLISFLPPIRAIVSASLWTSNPLNTPPVRTFAWIRENTGPDAVFATELDGRLFLHTGRRALRLLHAPDARSFAAWARREGVRYVLEFPNADILHTPRHDGPHDPLPVRTLAGLLAGSGEFEQVFEDPSERSRVYRLKPQKTEAPG